MILIGLGSNLITKQHSTSAELVQAALYEMENAGLQILRCSSFYETEPVPKSEQPWFVNAVARVTTDLNASDLLHLLHKIEEQLGRSRRKRWEARVIDLDLLCYDNLVVPEMNEWQSVDRSLNEDRLIIPHVRMHERDFVLIPLKEIAPDWKHPVLRKNACQLLREQESAGIVRQLK